LWGPGCYLVLGLILLFIAFSEGGFQGLISGAFGMLAIMWTFHWLFTHRRRAEELEKFFKRGDFQVWPFLRQADFEEAERQTQLETEARTRHP
jgi:hypothetical protein